jgi:hypothetical protein
MRACGCVSVAVRARAAGTGSICGSGMHRNMAALRCVGHMGTLEYTVRYSDSAPLAALWLYWLRRWPSTLMQRNRFLMGRRYIEVFAARKADYYAQAHARHICTGTALNPATPALGLG